MFAPPSKKKQSPKKKHSYVVRDKKSSNNNEVRVKYSFSNNFSQNKINKIASIRTLPPFARLRSQIQGNSLHKSNQFSETNSEVWKQQQLFESNTKQSIQSIDKQLNDVLQTIRKQRNLIDIKIWKLKQKVNQLNVKNNKQDKQAQITSYTLQMPQHDQTLQQQVQTQQIQKQSIEEVSQYFRQCCNQLDLCHYQDINNEEIEKVNDQIKIVQNKLILQMLLDKISEIA